MLYLQTGSKQSLRLAQISQTTPSFRSSLLEIWLWNNRLHDSMPAVATQSFASCIYTQNVLLPCMFEILSYFLRPEDVIERENSTVMTGECNKGGAVLKDCKQSFI